jgi:hypothetical protein
MQKERQNSAEIAQALRSASEAFRHSRESRDLFKKLAPVEALNRPRTEM